MSITAVRPKNFREKVFFRNLRLQIDGNAKIANGISQIRGVGKRMAQAIVRLINIDPNSRVGIISEKDLNRIEEIILDPISAGIPIWMVNRRKDTRSGKDIHVTGNKLEISVKRDIDRMKKMKSYKGVRHSFGLKVRGQKTKSTGRHGLVIGVARKKKGQIVAAQTDKK